MSTNDAETQAKKLADFLRHNGIIDVRVMGDVVSYPLTSGHVLLKVSVPNSSAQEKT